MTYEEYFDAVYLQDNSGEAPAAWIQWKGTDVCMDIRCVCGVLSHFDGTFCYEYECPHCGAKYAVGCNVKLIQLTSEQAAFVESERDGFKTGEL